MAFTALVLAILTHFLPLKDNRGPSFRLSKKRPSPFYTAQEKLQIEEEIAKLWKSIESNMGKNQIEMLEPPASDSAIEQLELLVGSELPFDFKASLKVHNGCLALLTVEEMSEFNLAQMKAFDIEDITNEIDSRDGWNFGSNQRGNLKFSLLFTDQLIEKKRGWGRSFTHVWFIRCDTGEIFKWDLQHSLEIGADPDLANEIKHPSFISYLREVASKSGPNEIHW